MSANFAPVVEGIALLMAEKEQIEARGPHFQVIHRFREAGKRCGPGEEILVVYLIYRAKQYLVHLSCSLLLLFDYLAHSRVPQTTSQIFAGMKADPFYQRHGANSTVRGRLTRKMSRSCLREYIHRIKLALKSTFREARLSLDPAEVLISHTISSNQATYQLRAKFDWIHIDLPIEEIDG
jgi:hypothetical protein